MSTDAPCSCAASAAQNAALPPPTTMTSASSFAMPIPLRHPYNLLLRRHHRHSAVRLRPAAGVVHEFLHLGKLAGIELAARLGDRQHVPPGRQRMQGDGEVAEDFL